MAGDDAPAQRDEKAFQIAVEHAVAADRVKRRLDDHELRLDKQGEKLATLERTVEKVERALLRIENFAEAASKTASQAISTRTLWLGVLAVLVPLIVVIVRQKS
jgi:hypothetical protein